MTPEELAAASGAPAREIVRLEALAERVARGGRRRGRDSPAAFEAALDAATRPARSALKSIAAYRYGLDFDPAEPTAAEVPAAAGRWLAAIGRRPDGPAGGPGADAPASSGPACGPACRCSSTSAWATRTRGCTASTPACMHEFLLATQALGHGRSCCCTATRTTGRRPCLSNIFPHVYMDVGEALNHVGARSAAILAEALEVVPFHKMLYSSDAFGLAELHYLGATGFRRDLAKVIGAFVADGAWSRPTASAWPQLIGAGNAAGCTGWTPAG